VPQQVAFFIFIFSTIVYLADNSWFCIKHQPSLSKQLKLTLIITILAGSTDYLIAGASRNGY